MTDVVKRGTVSVVMPALNEEGNIQDAISNTVGQSKNTSPIRMTRCRAFAYAILRDGGISGIDVE